MVAGLKGLKKQLDNEAKAREERKANGGGFVKALRDYELLKADGVLKFRILQELDEDAGTDETRAELGERKLGLIVEEHATPFNPNNPKGFRTARCTMETEGKCYGCERYADRSDESSKFWRKYTKVYLNVLAEHPERDENGKETGNIVKSVVVLGQKARSAIVEFLMEYSSETNTITDVVLKLSKSGQGTDTKYTVMQLRTKPEEFPAAGAELYDLEKVSPDIAYADQPAFYGGQKLKADEEAAPAAAAATFTRPATTDDDSW